MSPDDEVQQLWSEHRGAPFPSRLRGEEIAGVDMVMLDADVAGCVSVWLSSNGRLDEWRKTVLLQCLDELDRIVPLLQDADEREYYERVRQLARAALT